MLIRFDKFSGMAPLLLPERLPLGAAQAAQNVRFDSGGIAPIKQVQTVVTPAKAGTKKSIYPYGSPVSWLHWLEEVDVCKGAVASDGFDRVYWTGEGVPKMSVIGFITQGGTQYPTNSYNLGLPRPATPTAAVQGVAGSSIATQEEWSYVVTFLSAYGEESVPSLPTVGVTVDTATQHVHLASLPTAPAGAYNVVSKNIYRINSGSSAADYQYVGTVAIATTTYDDTVANGNLGEVLPSTKWLAPNSGLKGLVSCPGGFLVGFYNNVLCFSEPYRPHAWNPDYQIILKDQIVALAAFGNSILVVTSGAPAVITGSDPASMSKPEYQENGEACVGKRGVVDLGYSVAYPGATGLWLAGTGGVDKVTKKIMSLSQWQALNPAYLLGSQYDSAYVGFMLGGGGFILDAQGNYSTTDITATAAHYDQASGKLYLMVGNDIVEWCGGSSYYTASWKSGKVKLPKPVNLGWLEVASHNYPLTAKVYADGVLKSTQTISSGNPVSLPAGFTAMVWELEIIGGNGVYQAALATSVQELQ
jgi:hypothetical protein